MNNSKRLDFLNKYWTFLNRLDSYGKDSVIDLGMGMPDPTAFKVPRIILEKLHQSIDEAKFILYEPPKHPTTNDGLLARALDAIAREFHVKITKYDYVNGNFDYDGSKKDRETFELVLGMMMGVL